MKSFRLNILTALFFTISSLGFSQVGINTIAPDTSASLHIVSKPSGSGLIIPELTQAQRLAIFNPAQGLMVFDLSANLFYMNMTAGVHDWYAINPWLTKGNNTAHDVMYTSSVVTKVGIGISNPATALDVVGDINASASVTANTLNVNGFPANALVPAGAIMMWSGNPLVLPAGWALCDGTTHGTFSTPDLRGRFIVGFDPADPDYNYTGNKFGPSYSDASGTYTGTSTQEAKSIKLTVAQSGLPGHTHGITEPNGGAGHSHSYIAPSVQSGNGQYSGTGSYVNWGGGATTANSTTGITINPVNSANAVSAHENRPPYYVLAYIIKLP